MRESGSITRPIGRRDRLASPVSVTAMSWLATSPDRSRALVPLLPMSSGARGDISPPVPRPWTTQSAPSRSMATPIARSAAAVARTSSLSSRPEIRVSPSALAPSISARWLIDLSPGTAIVPRSGPPGVKVREGPFMRSRALTATAPYGKARRQCERA